MTDGRGHGALVAALTLFLILLVALHSAATRLDGGSFTYPLDDTYIHLAMAKHFAGGHGWGITRDQFASSSSSPLWTLLLSAWMGVFGVGDEAPLILGTLFGVAAVVVAYRLLRQWTRGSELLWIALVTAIVATPLPTLSLAGLEHVLQAALALSFVAECAWQLSSAAPPLPGARPRLIALAFLLGAVRYESLLLVAVACLLFAWRRSLGFAIVLGLAALTPVVAYGLWSVAHGWYFVPNSVLLKANIPTPAAGDFSRENPLGALLRSPHLLVLIAAALALLGVGFRAGRRWTWSQVALALFVGTAVLHLALARVGWLYRYEAYLVFMGVVVVAIGFESWLEDPARRPSVTWRRVAHAALFLLMLPLAIRASNALWRTPRASKNIHEQQFQMGTFLARYYPGAGVAANDIGAIAYLGEPKVLDLFGLADLDVGRRKLHETYDTQAIRELAQARGVKVAVVYDDWFAKLGGVPPEWVRVGEWTITHNVVCGSDRVTWYAVAVSEAAALTRHLREFSSSLPPDVRQAGAYRGS
jgi:hypothetical protein